MTNVENITTRVQEFLNDNHDAGLLPDGDPGPGTMGAVEAALKNPVLPGAVEVSDFEITARPLPDFCYSRHNLKSPDGVCIHYVSAIYSDPDKWADIATVFKQTVDLNRVKAEREFYPGVTGKSKARVYASYHFLIGRDGRVYQLAPLAKRAHHAGRSIWAGREGCNAWSFGVALIAHGEISGRAASGYTDAQYETLQGLIKHLKTTNTINEIFGHDECAPGRKHDPGALFDWSRVR